MPALVYPSHCRTDPTRALLLLAALACLAPAPPLSAQETQSPLSPAGRLRVDVAGLFVSWDERFTDDGTEPLQSDLETGDLSESFGGSAALEEEMRALLGDAEYDGMLGPLHARISADRTRVPIRIDLGIFDWLTVGGTVPFVKNRTEIAIDYGGDAANLGVNPALTAPSTVDDYLQALDAARAASSERASDLCSTDPGGAACMEAEVLASDLAAFFSGMQGAFEASPFFPAEATEAGDSLVSRSQALSGRLQAAGLAGLAGLPLPTLLGGREALDAFLESTLLTPPLANRVPLWEVGDVEAHVLARLAEGGADDPDASLRYQVGAGALVRLGTGAVDDPDVLFDLPAGGGQTDLEGRVFLNLETSRFGLWADARYGIQRSTVLARRVGPPDVVFRSPEGLRNVEWDPGDYLRVEIAPRLQLTREVALSAGWRLWYKGGDTFEAPPLDSGDAPPAPADALNFFADPSLLGLETEETRHELGVGLTYSTRSAWSEGRTAVPFEARALVRKAVAGSGGRTPETLHLEFGLRLYRRIWGG